MKKIISKLLLLVAFVAVGCKDNKKETQNHEIEINGMKELKSALTFYASYDSSVNADFALGNDQMYSVMNRKALDSSVVGLKKDSVSLIRTKGKIGGALLFKDKTRGYIYYKSKNNISYNTKNWSGAISFWLQLDPNEDLKPGFCDPIQITDVSYNDASIWVDFTKTSPRAFRLGVIEDRDAWNPNPKGPDNENPDFINMLVPVENPPFSRANWTHIFINFSGLNSENGKAELYLNGKKQGQRNNISHPFSWELKNSNIYLGLSYIGLFDELSIYNRKLTEDEITSIYESKDGIHSVLK